MNTFGSVFLSVPATMSAPGQSSKPWNISPSSFGAHNSVSNGNGCKTPPNSPWGTHNLAGLSRGHNVMTLEEVMSEQLADQLQLHNSPLAPVAVLAAAVDESTSFPNTDENSNIAAIAEAVAAIDGTDNDAALAKMLQAEFDEEYNWDIQNRENNQNKNCKVKINYDNYKIKRCFAEEVDEEDEEDDEEEEDEFHSHVDSSDQTLAFNNRGYTKFGNKVVTKHDLEINGRRNTAKMEDSMPPSFHTGDTRGMDLLLDNRTYNSFERHANKVKKRSHKVRETKDTSTAEHAIDDKTKVILTRMQDRGLVAEVYGIISKGKEAVVLHADGGDGVDASQTGADVSTANKHDSKFVVPTDIPKEIAIKVYQTQIVEYKGREKYIAEDYRFKSRFKKLNDRKIIYMWAEKEMHNLKRMRAHGMLCPRVVALKNHVLFMSFIGKDGKSAPQLRQARLSKKQQAKAYEQVVEIMKTMYQKCHLVHGDLSEFNLLWHENKVWVIDVSQSVEPTHPQALTFLLRDCKNVHNFFTKLAVGIEVLEPMELFNEVSGLDISAENEQEFILRTEEMERDSHEHAMKRRLANSLLLSKDDYGGEEEEDYAGAAGAGANGVH